MYDSFDGKVLIDERSQVEIYIGNSVGFSDENLSIWKIKKIWKVGTVWYFGYPDGDQDYSYVWSQRLDYEYL